MNRLRILLLVAYVVTSHLGVHVLAMHGGVMAGGGDHGCTDHEMMHGEDHACTSDEHSQHMDHKLCLEQGEGIVQYYDIDSLQIDFIDWFLGVPQIGFSEYMDDLRLLFHDPGGGLSPGSLQFLTMHYGRGIVMHC